MKLKFYNKKKTNTFRSVDFSILSESGTFQHWKYQAQYTEKLSHWPYFKNVATADFSIHSNWRQNLYFINSTHTTCFFAGFYCCKCFFYYIFLT